MAEMQHANTIFLFKNAISWLSFFRLLSLLFAEWEQQWILKNWRPLKTESLYWHWLASKFSVKESTYKT